MRQSSQSEQGQRSLSRQVLHGPMIGKLPGNVCPTTLRKTTGSLVLSLYPKFRGPTNKLDVRVSSIWHQNRYLQWQPNMAWNPPTLDSRILAKIFRRSCLLEGAA